MSKSKVLSKLNFWTKIGLLEFCETVTKRQRGPEPQSRYAAENVNNSSCEKTGKGFWTVINPFMGLHHVPLVSLEFAVIVQIGNTLKLHILVIGAR